MTKSKHEQRPTSQSVYIPGVDFATACSGTKYKNRDDLLMIALDPGSHVLWLFSQFLRCHQLLSFGQKIIIKMIVI